VLSLDEAIAVIEGHRRLDRDAVALTFDDGYRDLHTRVMPILSRLALPATVFVPTGYLDGGHLTHDRLHAALWTAWQHKLDLGIPPVEPPFETAVEALIARLPARALRQIADAWETVTGPPPLDRDAHVLSPAQLRDLSAAGWEIGAHTVEHAVLSRE